MGGNVVSNIFYHNILLTLKSVACLSEWGISMAGKLKLPMGLEDSERIWKDFEHEHAEILFRHRM